MVGPKDMLSPGLMPVGFSKDGEDPQLADRNRRNPNPTALSVFGSEMSERNIELSCFLDSDQLPGSQCQGEFVQVSGRNIVAPKRIQTAYLEARPDI